ncbi:TPA: fimbrial protein [Haemophilus influenzae]|uniref:fimbrial protein n=1 Tax=Haemophilus influenzae TaxID=727 RepID=UPI0010C4B4FB|nr:fimbrial protein [Haemophilus influenzae]VTP75062.1 HifD [Haemophilus influenzae]
MQKTPKKLTALYARKSIACGGQTLSAFCRQIALFACFIAQPLYAYDGRVTFEGEILSDGTCKIETDSQNRTVTLPTVGKANLSREGQTAAPVPFSITLKECNKVDAGNSALLFSGATARQPYLSNTASSGKANNVGIQIVKADGAGTPVKVDGSQSDNVKASGTGKAQNGIVIQPRFDYFAHYYATGAATAGNVEATATFQVQYK